ncbi:general stress protein 13 [Granulicatella balaenopterae]|uniref:General stress protein 13 n=1 Tax=Granulicatella balaenopterae TaxID=137733 RepID=A0A1H9NR14_9LACT|nr:CvfD/Ygs/GSP13 family RNA-binding post-transcriptional regulator [Granulicatella balaenopterae]SER38105.1 general stress protein 13 [Granulicatella balaenopterae]
MTLKYKIGDILTGTVTGIQAYGVFVSLDEETQGLVHISECKHGYMENLQEFVKVGDIIQAKIIDIDEYTQKISLSMRALQSLDTPSEPAKRKRRKKRYTPSIGFVSLEQQMPKWIEEAKREFVESKNENKNEKENA